MVSVAFENALSGGPSANRGDVLDAALAYLETGWAVINGPGCAWGECGCSKGLSCDNVAKHPYGGWSDRERRTLTESQARWAWGDERVARAPDAITENLFIVCYLSGMVVADVDNVKAWKASREAGWEYPETLAARTGSGGLHLFYAKNWDRGKAAPRLARSGLPGEAGDVRWKSVVVAPPSAHVLGGSYSWLNWGAEIAMAPDWLAQEKVETRLLGPPDDGGHGLGVAGSERDRWATHLRDVWFADVAGFGRISSEYVGMARNRPGKGFAIACRAGWLIAWGIMGRRQAADKLMGAARRNGWATDSDAERQILNGIDTGIEEVGAA